MQKRRRRYISSKKYKNKYFYSRYKKKRILHGAKMVLIFFLFLFFSAFLFYFIFDKKFQFNDILIKGAPEKEEKEISILVQEKIKQKKFLFFPCSYFLIDLCDLKKEINNKYYFEELTITKKYPHSLLLQIKEKKPFFLLKNINEYYLLDKQGRIIKKTDITDNKNNLIFIVSKLKKGLKIKEKFLSEESLALIYKTKSIIKTDIKEYQIDSYQITLLLANGFKIYFSRLDNPNEQVNKLKSFLESNKNFSYKGEYLDLRFQDKVYLK